MSFIINRLTRPSPSSNGLILTSRNLIMHTSSTGCIMSLLAVYYVKGRFDSRSSSLQWDMNR